MSIQSQEQRARSRERGARSGERGAGSARLRRGKMEDGRWELATASLSERRTRSEESRKGRELLVILLRARLRRTGSLIVIGKRKTQHRRQQSCSFFRAVHLATLVGGSLGLFFKWIDRKFLRAVDSARAARQTSNGSTNTNVRTAGIIRHCPVCHSQMIKRKARRGSRAGQEFWGCPNFPDCRGMRPI